MIQLRAGPISRGSSNKFINKISNLLNNFDEYLIMPDSCYNFRKLVNAGVGIKVMVVLEESPSGLDI